MSSFLDRTTLILAGLTAALYIFAYHKTGEIPWAPIGRAGQLFVNILPRIACGLLMGMLLMDILPKRLVEGWLSDRSGWRGLLLGWLAGSIMPMGAPFVLFPMAAGLLKGGAGVGPIVALLTSAGLLGPFRIVVFELPIMGSGFFFLRFLSVFWFPPMAGYLAQSISHILGGR